MLQRFKSKKAALVLVLAGSFCNFAFGQETDSVPNAPSENVPNAVGQVLEAEAVPSPLEQAAQKTAEHVKNCHDNVSVQQQVTKELKARRDAAKEARQFTVSVLQELRTLLTKRGCSVLVDGKSYSKEAIARVIEVRLDILEQQSQTLDSLESELLTARDELEQLVAKAKRWEAAQKLLLAKLDRVLKAKNDPDKQADIQQAELEAAALADAITVKISKSKAEAKADDLTDTSAESTLSEKKVIPALVSEAIAEFQRIFDQSPE